MLTNLPYASNSFDLVFSSDVLEHIHEDEVCIINKSIRCPCTLSRFFRNLFAHSALMACCSCDSSSLRLWRHCVLMHPFVTFPALHQCAEHDGHNRPPSCDGTLGDLTGGQGGVGVGEGIKKAPVPVHQLETSHKGVLPKPLSLLSRCAPFRLVHQ